MQAFLNFIRREYGGVDAYFAKYTSVTAKDMRRIRDNYLVPEPKSTSLSQCLPGTLKL